jgi:hypothetical protein
MSSGTGGGQSRSLILTAMIFAVAMTFIDQTIVSIAAPTIQHDLGLSSSGMQWAINAGFVALRGLKRGVQLQAGEGAGQFAGEDPDADLYPAPR